MHRHLVSVKIGVERFADKWGNSDRFPFHQDWRERLNPEPVQCRWPVEQDRVVFDDFFEHVPHRAIRINMFDISLGALDGAGVAVRLQPFNDKRLEQLHRHLFRDTTLV